MRDTLCRYRAGFRNKIVPPRGYKLKNIHAEGLPRKLNLDLLRSFAKAFQGLGEARRIIKDFKPDLVLGTGGYVCGPVVLCAYLLKCRHLSMSKTRCPV